MTDHNPPPYLPLLNMADRHHALTPALAASYLEAARVCLDRHHLSPQEFIIENDGVASVTLVTWEKTDNRTQAAWANQDDATRDGAYSMAIAATELVCGMVAVRRAETRTGSDYYISLPGEDGSDLEKCLRLEVSGTSSDKKSVVKQRLREKLDQASKGDSDLPALAAIIGFRVQLILIQAIEV